MDITQSIVRFITSRIYHYALMINGAWGSGKTYYVKEQLMPYIKENLKCDVNYITLYGIKSTDEISQMLCVQAIKDKLPQKAGSVLDSRGGQILSGIASTVLKPFINSMGLTNEDLSSAINAMPNFDNNVIILDDLERCSCEINEVLGYINNFVEHSDASVILVANESEIGRWQLERNPELQMMIAMDSKIEIQSQNDSENQVEKEEGKKSKQYNNKITPEEIERRRKVVFNSNSVYQKTKEKVIGITINYEPDLYDIFTKFIVNKIKSEMLMQDLNTNLSWFVEIAILDNHKNLRTFQYYLEKICVIYETIIEQDDIFSNNHELKQNILRYTYRSSIRYMKGLTMPKWTAEYGVQKFGQDGTYDAQYQEFGFKFIDDLIVRNMIDRGYVNKTLSDYLRITEKKGQLKDDPYGLLKDWRLVDEITINDWLDAIVKNILDNENKNYYSTELYTGILFRIAELKVNNVSVDRCVRIVNAMKKYISEQASELEDLESNVYYFLDGAVEVCFNGFFETISFLLEKKKETIEKEKYENLIKNVDNWATCLLEASKEKATISGHSFIYLLDPQQLLNRIEISCNKELFQFHCVLDRLCSTDYLKKKDDNDHLIELQKGINELIRLDTNMDSVKRANIVLINEDLRKYVKRINEDIDD